MTIWMKVTEDDYELPLAVADSLVELAEMLGVRANTISAIMSHYKSHDGEHYKPCPYVKIEEDDYYWIRLPNKKFKKSLVIAKSLDELAEKCGVKARSILNTICTCKGSGKECNYIKVLREEW